MPDAIEFDQSTTANLNAALLAARNFDVGKIRGLVQSEDALRDPVEEEVAAGRVMLQYHDRSLDGKMSVLVDDDGNLVDSWLGFSLLTIANLNGTFKCQNNACKLDASTTSPLVTVNLSSEQVSASGQANALKGRLGAKDNDFEFTATEPNRLSDRASATVAMGDAG